MSSSQSPSNLKQLTPPARITDKDVIVEQPAPSPTMTTQNQPAMRVRGGCCPCVRYFLVGGFQFRITYAYSRIAAFHAAPVAVAVEGRRGHKFQIRIPVRRSQCNAPKGRPKYYYSSIGYLTLIICSYPSLLL